jgi:DNA-binding transcriptional ArsR family regulator
MNICSDMKIKIAPARISEKDAVRLAELFSALADPSRVRILSAIQEDEMSVGDIAGVVGLSESAVSHHLRGLRMMRLVRARKEGREVYYALDDEHVDGLFSLGLEHVSHG